MLTIKQVKAATMGLQVVALAITVLRIWIRLRIGRFWYDDGLAAMAGLFCIVKVASSWFLVDSKGSSVACFWITTISFPCIIWLARTSILLSITRIAWPTRLLFRLSLGSVILFFSMWVSTIIQRAVRCKPNNMQPRNPFCKISDGSIVFLDFATSCVSDIILLAFSFRLLWNINLPTRQRRMILIILSSSIMLSLLSMFRAISYFALNSPIVTLSVNLEVPCSLIVCNLLVVVTYAYRVFNRKSDVDQEDDDYSSPVQMDLTSQPASSRQPASSQQPTSQPASSLQLTTVEFNTFIEASTSRV